MDGPAAHALISRLGQAQPVEVSLRPRPTAELLEAAVNRGHIHLRFPGTRGGTELGVRLERGACDLGGADFRGGTGTLRLVGEVSLDGVGLRCHADIELRTFQGLGRVERLDGLGPAREGNGRSAWAAGGASEVARADEPVEEQLTRIWREILGVGAVGLDDRFFLELGADSVMAARAIAGIKRTFGVDLPATALLEQDTVRRQAAYLRGARIPVHERGVETLKQGAPGSPPLFLIHPVAGVCFPYRTLTRRLGAERTVHGLYAVQLDTGDPMPPVEALAAAYLARVKRVQPRGPYLLGGWSFGGALAFEMAAQLQEGGDEVTHLLLLDAAPPETSLAATARSAASGLWRWILRHPDAALRLPLLGTKLRQLTRFERFMMGSVLALDPFESNTSDFRALLSFALGADTDAEVLDALPSGTDAQLNRWYEAMRAVAIDEERARYFLPGMEGPAAARLVRVIAQSVALELRYRPRRRYTGPVSLFAVQGDRAARRWQRHCDHPLDLREYPIQGIGRYPAHFCMLDEENVGLFASDVDAVLAAAAKQVPAVPARLR
jgi:thioesterase domain-containing protein/acyl carrier protein